MTEHELSVYAQARQIGQEARSKGLLELAKRLLKEEGPAALTVRRIAAEAGCSTKVIYTTFGGKDGLAEALYLEGFAQFRKKMLQVPASSNPMARLRALSAAYREIALADPDYYRVMFESAIPGFKPSPETLEKARVNFHFLIQAVADCSPLNGNADHTAETLWAAQHGIISLELAGYLDEKTALQRYESLMEELLKSFFANQGPEGTKGAG